MSNEKPVTFAGLKKQLRDEVQPVGLTVRTVMLETVRELEALEQRVRKLRDELLQPTNSASETRHNRHVADKLTALLGDKP